MPLSGEADGPGFFIERPGGGTRWAYTDYQTPFPLTEGGNWTDSEHLYRTPVMFGDATLKERALDLMRHDVHVKLDLERMFFPPYWTALSGKLQDHRDDRETMAGLAYCAEVSAQILYPRLSSDSWSRAITGSSWTGNRLMYAWQSNWPRESQWTSRRIRCAG